MGGQCRIPLIAALLVAATTVAAVLSQCRAGSDVPVQHWSPADGAEWVASIGLPQVASCPLPSFILTLTLEVIDTQYAQVFVEHELDGAVLSSAEFSVEHWRAMGVTKVGHVARIMSQLRRLVAAATTETAHSSPPKTATTTTAPSKQRHVRDVVPMRGKKNNSTDKQTPFATPVFSRLAFSSTACRGLHGEPAHNNYSRNQC